MPMNFPQLMTRLVGRPLLVTPDKARIALGILTERAGIEGVLIEPNADTVTLESLAPSASIGPSHRSDRKLFRQIDGIAIIPVEGTLVNKLGTLNPWSGMTGYDGLTVKLSAALEDADVRGILFDIESPGGEVAGCFDLADRIFEGRETKPIWASLSEEAYSAAYALASQCDRIIVPRTGGAGSIGVVCMHGDWSGALDIAK